MKPTAGSLSTRIAALEAEHRTGPLTRAEAAELERIEEGFNLRFPGALADMTDDDLGDFIRWHSSPAAARVAELRERSRSPEQDAADRVQLARLLGIEVDQLDAFKARALDQLVGGSHGRTHARGD